MVVLYHIFVVPLSICCSLIHLMFPNSHSHIHIPQTLLPHPTLFTNPTHSLHHFPIFVHPHLFSYSNIFILILPSFTNPPLLIHHKEEHLYTKRNICTQKGTVLHKEQMYIKRNSCTQRGTIDTKRNSCTQRGTGVQQWRGTVSMKWRKKNIVTVPGRDTHRAESLIREENITERSPPV